MGRSLPSFGWVALTVLVTQVVGCAAHQPPASSLSATLVKGPDGTGGVPWPTAEGAAAVSAPKATTSGLPLELTSGPREKHETREAKVLEAADPGLKEALEEAARAPSAESLRAVADEYQRLGVFDRAYGYLQRAIALAPLDSPTREAMARLWRDWGVPAEGLGDAYRAVSADPGAPEAQNTLGTLLFALGYVEAASERFSQAVALDGRAAYAHNNLCYGALTRHQLERAEEHCRAALALDPALESAHNNLGLVLAAAGRSDDAFAEFTTAAGDEATAFYNLGVAHFTNGAFAPAAEAFEAALALRPTFELARTRARQARGMSPIPADGPDRKR